MKPGQEKAGSDSESKGDRSERKGRVGGTSRSQERGGVTQETFVPRRALAYLISYLRRNSKCLSKVR